MIVKEAFEKAVENKDFFKKQPFLIVFHSANDEDYVTKILESEHNLPQEYMGRKIEYAFEVDYFWTNHNGKFSGFFGHAFHTWQYWTLKKDKKILKMRNGKTNAKSLLKRKGLIFPEWMLSRIDKIRLMIEIKSGWGEDTKALNELIKKIEAYRLENNILFIGFSAWPLHYLKQRLPKATTVLIITRVPIAGRLVLPLNRPLQTLRQFGLFLPHHKIDFVDIIDTPTKKSKKGVVKQIRQASNDGKLFIGGKVDSREKFDWLIKYGARGAIIWKHPKTIVEWLSSAVEQ